VGDRAKVSVLSLEGKRRRPGCNLQPANFRQGIEELFSQSLGEVLLFLIAAHVHERKHRDRVRRWVKAGGGSALGGGPRRLPHFRARLREYKSVCYQVT